MAAIGVLDAELGTPLKKNPKWTFEEAKNIFSLPLNDLLYHGQTIHRQHFDPNTIQISTLLSIKTSGCPENCAYCPQSAHYKTGLATAGLYDVKVSKSGYYPKTITGVSLNNGILTTLNVQLVPFQTYAFSGSVTDSLTGLGVSNADVVISSASGLIYKTRSDASVASNEPSEALEAVPSIHTTEEVPK